MQKLCQYYVTLISHISVYYTSVRIKQHMYATYSVIHYERWHKNFTACTLAIFVMFMYIFLYSSQVIIMELLEYHDRGKPVAIYLTAA